MGTRSLTYIYDQYNQVLCILFLQFDGYLAGYGADLAKFLHQFNTESTIDMGTIDMGNLAVRLIASFKESYGYAGLISPYSRSLCFREEYEYHIYPSSIKVFANKEYEMEWTKNDFIELCNRGEEDEEDE